MKEVEKIEETLYGDRNVDGKREFLGKFTIIKLIVNHRKLKEFKDKQNRIIYDGKKFYMSDNIEAIDKNYFLVTLIQI